AVRLPDPSAGPNVLLVTLDTTRADRLGCYGYAAARTPALDGLARDGVRFARAYCPVPLTLPSHATILTGLYPVGHGVRNNGRALPADVPTLAAILKENGYETAAFVSAFSVDSRFGLDRGFDVYDDMLPSELPVKSQNAERRAEATFNRFSRWLDKRSGGRFFSWVHFYDPHLPYNPPEPYRQEFSGRLYDGEVAYMDHYVGAVLDRLRAKGLLETTLVVVAGDHGEGFGDKVEVGHGLFLYEETMLVPLILHHPGIFLRPRVVEGAVQLTDVAPTVLGILGLGADAAAMHGRSLIPRISRPKGEGTDSLIETVYPRENFGWSELVGWVTGSWKYIQSPKPELYDLERDPEEKSNLIDRAPDRARALKKRLDDGLLALSAGRPSAAGAGSEASPESLDRLRSLGYVNFAPDRPGAAVPDPKDRLDLLRLIQQAQGYEMEERYAEAEQVYLRIVDDIPDSAESYVNLAIAQARQQKFDLAVETLKKGTARLPDSQILLFRLGFTYLVAGRVPDARETLDKVLALNPRNIDALTIRAGILDASGRKDEAIGDFERALAVEPESRYLRMSYAGSLASVGRLSEAILLYEGLIEDFPEEQAFYQYAGIARSYLGDYDRAIQLLERAVAIRPTPVGYFNLAVAHDRSGRPDEAARYLRLYLENPRGESEANIQRARAELERLERKGE
ncbi:MAG: tetratricopeptide repeat protein, partial [Candidatus Aminicenantes bacterium]|nr:tetratricopeptide repeat protein [Candidatus Aminicenantes bacterium]